MCKSVQEIKEQKRHEELARSRAMCKDLIATYPELKNLIKKELWFFENNYYSNYTEFYLNLSEVFQNAK